MRLNAAESGELTREKARHALEEIFAGAWDDERIAAWLEMLSARGETVAELVGFAEAMRAAMTDMGAEPGMACVDTCGTGGGGRRTFNISTAAALVAAGAGLRVAKHGNRSSTSVCGSADVLEAAGVNLEYPAALLGECLAATGFAFLYAPLLHPAMKRVAAARRALRSRTVFNLVGPLTNPAGAEAQVVGVVSAEMAPLMAGALRELGTRHSLVVYSEDGLGELSTTALNLVTEVRGGKLEFFHLDARDLGLPRAELRDLSCGSRAEAVEGLIAVLNGSAGAHRDVVLLNAAAALRVGGMAADWERGLELAAKSIDSGAARAKLEEVVAFTAKDGEDG